MISARSPEFAAELDVVNILKEGEETIHTYCTYCSVFWTECYWMIIFRCFWLPHLFPGDFLLRTSFTNHRIFGTDLIMGLWKQYFVYIKAFFFQSSLRPVPYLDRFEVKWLFTVLAVERSLRTLAFVMTLLFVQSNELFAQGTRQDHELTLPLVTQLQQQWYDTS